MLHATFEFVFYIASAMDSHSHAMFVVPFFVFSISLGPYVRFRRDDFCVSDRVRGDFGLTGTYYVRCRCFVGQKRKYVETVKRKNTFYTLNIKKNINTCPSSFAFCK